MDNLELQQPIRDDVAPDGSRFLMVKEPPEQAPSDQLHIAVNWFTELQQRIPLK